MGMNSDFDKLETGQLLAFLDIPHEPMFAVFRRTPTTVTIGISARRPEEWKTLTAEEYEKRNLRRCDFSQAQRTLTT